MTDKLGNVANILPPEDEEEIWRACKNYPGYQVSSFGRVIGPQKRILKLYVDKNGYQFFRVSIKGKKSIKKVHRVVAEVFLGQNPVELPEVDHIDRCRCNNYYKNLRYANGTQQRYNSNKRAEYLNRKKTPIILMDRNTDEPIQYFNSPVEAGEKLGLSIVQICANLHKQRDPFKIGYFIINEEKLDKK